MSRPFVIYWNNIPAPYMVDRFNALADRNNMEFQAWFNDRTHSDRSWGVEESAWRFDYRYLPVTRIGGLKLHWPLPVFGRRPDLIFSLYAEPVFISGWLAARSRGIKTGFRVLKTFDAWVKRNRIKDAVKRFMFKRVDAIETPGMDGREFALKYGALSERVFYATHTVDIDTFQKSCVLTKGEQETLRAQGGLIGFTFIYVGRLMAGKGLDLLIEAFSLVQQRCAHEVSLLLVGDGPQEAALRKICETSRIRNVVFTGFVQKRDLPRFYALADTFVFPTLGDPYGIVVDEAMACSLPIISTTAAGEIRGRVQDGVNGFLVMPGDSQTLAAAMLTLADHMELREQMGKISAHKVKNHTPQQWAQDFERMVHAVLSEG